MLRVFFVAAICLLSNVFANCGCAKCILDSKFAPTDKRYKTFELAIELLNKKPFPTIVETGTSRFGRANCEGDGCSTIVFAEWIKDHGGQFFSVDISPTAIENAKQGLGDLNPYVQIVCQDSGTFLHNFNRPIDFLYLDSYDFEFNNPLPSQFHHLKEIAEAYPHLAEDCIVMIDDCDLPHGGKGRLAIAFLLKRGWKIIANGYQVLLTRG